MVLVFFPVLPAAQGAGRCPSIRLPLFIYFLFLFFILLRIFFRQRGIAGRTAGEGVSLLSIFFSFLLFLLGFDAKFYQRLSRKRFQMFVLVLESIDQKLNQKK